VRTSRDIPDREPRIRFRSSTNAVGNAMLLREGSIPSCGVAI
jgi:hypothetical protein